MSQELEDYLSRLEAIKSAVIQWLDDNKEAVLAAIKEAIREHEELRR